MMQPRPASTLALLRDSADGFEVLMLQRSRKAAFLPGYYVFPGGAVDAGDADSGLAAFADGHDEASARELLGVEHDALGYLVAAIRECFEEAGLLLARDDAGQHPGPAHPVLASAREPVTRGELSLAALCDAHGLRLPLGEMTYIDHWVTPPGAPRRFDTRFFLARAPADQVPAHDGRETINHCWLTPQEALTQHRAGKRQFGAPTLTVLRRLARFNNAADALDDARRRKPKPFPTEPWPARKNGDPILLHPGDAAYPEVRKRDPQAYGQLEARIEPGQWTPVGESIWRLTVPNPSVMTGPGTNSYLIRDPGGDLVIDPGPHHEQHLHRLLDQCGGQLRAILVTHTHGDHSPGAQALKAATGAPLIGLPPPADGHQDLTFRPDHIPADGETIELDGTRLKILHTPGHASNHLCFLHEGEGMLFSGDHIMQGSTVVINPPDGDMTDYLNALMNLLEEEMEWIAPGHGFLMAYPQLVIDLLVTHRLSRERKVVRALRKVGPAPLETLVGEAYADAATALHRMAERSLLAHLLKLEKDGRARREGDDWVLC
ncbi:MBL fold metallo-hydrolase [Marinobacter bohaiensis]|uniref:MBL fold metallo-hydrolase n=1 Tax=Marinobacter bohaiensis TaxID=2201898 RepID=UPI002AF6B6DA|nr:MBL fold metallo-hydrolase [Marinobacter bohaiensis]